MTVSETSGTISNAPTFELQGSQKKKRKRKGMRKLLKRLQLKISPTKQRSQSSPRGTKRPIQDKPKEKHARHILIKLTKTKHKERTLKAAREKQQVTYKGSSICLTADPSAETLQARREWQDIFKVLKGKIYNQNYCIWQGSHSKIDGEIKSFSDKQKLREFSTNKLPLQKMLN